MELWAYEYDLYKTIWILSPPFTPSFCECVYLAHGSGDILFSVLSQWSGLPSVCALRLSDACAREMQKCEREMQQRSSCFIPRSLALLMECFSELLVDVVSFFPAGPHVKDSRSLARSHAHTHSREAEDSCALNDLGSMIFVSVIRLEAQFCSAKRHLKSDSCQPDLLQQKCASVTSNTPE